MESLMAASPLRRKLLADPALNERLTRFVRAKLGDSDAGDVVQATLTEALAAKSAPESEEELTRWVFGIARHEIADHFRKRRREVPADLEDHDEGEPPPSGNATGLMRWAERELPPGSENQKTLEWMMREGEGEKLEHIAEESNVPPARVRKRVSRLRQHFRLRWAAAIAAAVVAIVLIVLALRRREGDIVAPLPPRETAPLPSIVPAPSPEQRANDLRELAFDDCAHDRWQTCVDRLDEAKGLDPAGDTTERVQNARKAATKALAPQPSTPPAPTSAPPPPPTVTAIPTATPTAPRTTTVVPTATAPPRSSGTSLPSPAGSE